MRHQKNVRSKSIHIAIYALLILCITIESKGADFSTNSSTNDVSTVEVNRAAAPIIHSVLKKKAGCDSVIYLPTLPQLCWNDDPINLVQITGISPKDGYWISLDTLLPGITSVSNDSLNGALRNNILDPQKTNPAGGKYYLRYLQDAACPVWKDTIITIHALPQPQITETPFMLNGNTPPYAFCVVDNPVSMTANPTGGAFNSDYSGAVAGNSFRPQGSPTGSPFWIRYRYTDPVTTCLGLDSVQVVVYAAPTINITRSDTAFCRYDNMTMNLFAEVKNSDQANSGMIFQPNRPALVMGYNRSITIPSRNDSVHVWRVVGFANDPKGVCPEATDVLNIITYPVPDATITPDDPEGCMPHEVTWTTVIKNAIDTATTTYNWDFSDGGTSTRQNPIYTYETAGTNITSLSMTSAFGCDTTLISTIDVYPNPVANFLPDPNNSTTVKLPKFQFTDKSGVQDKLNAGIISYFWDFGDPLDLKDTSTKRHPTWIYRKDTGTYQVTLVVKTNHGCVDSIIKPVVVVAQSLVIGPNPAWKSFLIDYSGTEPRLTEVKLIDIYGHEMAIPTTQINDKIQEIDVRHLSGGIYFLVLRFDNTTYKERIFIRSH